jgi:hypothetical protein
VSAGAPNLAPDPLGPGEERIVGPRGPQPPTGTELVTTAIQATAELAQIGLTIAGQIVRRALGRLPRP